MGFDEEDEEEDEEEEEEEEDEEDAVDAVEDADEDEESEDDEAAASFMATSSSATTGSSTIADMLAARREFSIVGGTRRCAPSSIYKARFQSRSPGKISGKKLFWFFHLGFLFIIT